MLKSFVLPVFSLLFVFSEMAAQVSYQEKYRNQFHFSQPAGWANDPNGLVYLKGEYHLFFQYYPKDTKWGPMHWGHAVSKDLVTWQNLPFALAPDSLGYIFSGSVVADKDNTSGFFPDTKTGLVAIFTHDNKGFQSQSIAYSLDNGRTWMKFSSNPVIPNFGIKDFRDPKVSWYEPEKKWVMTLSLPAEHKILFYASKNLRNWEKTGEFFCKSWKPYRLNGEFFPQQGWTNALWECPDLFEMKVEESGEKKWVLLVSVSESLQGGSGMQYFTGSFDGKTFTNDDPAEQVRWLDYGKDFYAGVTFTIVR